MMKLIRNINGNDEVIELTSDEMYRIYQAQKRKFYLEEISYAIECFNDGKEEHEGLVDEELVLSNEEVCNTIIKHYEDYLYTNDGERWYDMIGENVPDECYIPRF